MNIIVVEDEPAIREGICRQIEKTDPEYRVVATAGRGNDGLELIREKKPELVVTDVRMPGMDGISMIRSMREDGDKTKVIILSAYSEFEYAKQAIRLGVEEYLLKPVNIMELKAALQRIDEQCRFEQSRSGGALKSLPDICTGLVIGTLKSDERVKHALETEYGFSDETRFAVLQIYLGESFEKLHADAAEWANDMLSREPELRGCALEFIRDKSVLLMLYGFDDEKQLLRRITEQTALFRARTGQPERLAFGWITAKGAYALRTSVQSLLSLLEWSIVLPDADVIECERAANIHAVPCPYPSEQEARMKAALCSGDRDKLADAVKRFDEYFRKNELYSPKEIKESYIRFIWAGASIAKDINFAQKPELDMQRVLERIAEARTAAELSDAVQSVVSAICGGGKDEMLSLTVLRVRGMINEFYNTGITLNEIADKLSLTPEYVGTQFKKEMGVSFSNYIRQCRMDKAKELLLTGTLKLYEIAAAVGYTDAKYFSRQFKETVGQLPGDYKKTH